MSATDDARNLFGKVALITGAASGIGAATAREFARRGVFLALVDRNETGLQRVADDCWRHLAEYEKAQRPLVIVGDLTVADDVRRFVDKTMESFGHLDILVNNAGIGEFGSTENASVEQYDRVMDINVRAAFHLSLLAVPHLSGSKGCVINVSSTAAGSNPMPGMIVYNMSKAALDQMTRCMAVELASKGVRVNCVKPGTTTNTRIYEALGMDQETIEKHRERRRSSFPLGKLCEPEDIARAIAFLASRDASFTTGQMLQVDSGFHLTTSASNDAA